MKPKIAHSGNPPELLLDHSNNVAQGCALRASKFGLRELGVSLGFLHDFGKATEYTQALLYGEANNPNGRHPRLGALALISIRGTKSKVIMQIAFLIECHHSGLINFGNGKKSQQEAADFTTRIVTPFERQDEWLPEVIDFTRPHLEGMQIEGNPLSPMQIRVMMSCLIDSDWSSTAAFYGKNFSENPLPSISSLRARSEDHYNHLLSDAPSTPLNQIRSNYYREALTKAPNPKGWFVLNMQVGTGKTLTHARFAIEHANHHNMDGLIIAVPYLAIITQNVNEYRRLFGDTIVIESHSNVNWDALEEELDDKSVQFLRDACATWEGRIILTTTVELLETMYTHRNSRLRKLHNYHNKVVVIDEYQSIPQKFMRPVFHALNQLVDTFECSVVLCSATDASTVLQQHNLLPEYTSLVTLSDDPILNRVQFDYRAEPVTWKQLAKSIEDGSATQVMCITNTVRGASYLFDALEVDPQHKFHLSNMMTTEHKERVLAEVQRRLDAAEPVYLICTPIVEAGVDIDFSRVWRQEAPIDRIIQAGGRCNRHGGDMGYLTVFRILDYNGNRESDFLLPTLEFDEGQQASKYLFDHLNDADVVERYYRELSSTWSSPAILDSLGILEMERRYEFRNVSKKFKLIDDNYVKVDIIIPVDRITLILEKVRNREKLKSSEYQVLHRYTVSIPVKSMGVLKDLGKIEPLPDDECPIFYALSCPYFGGIHEKGLAHELYHYIP